MEAAWYSGVRPSIVLAFDVGAAIEQQAYFGFIVHRPEERSGFAPVRRIASAPFVEEQFHGRERAEAGGVMERR